ncbi:MAG: precorrin-3B synthase [Pseudomonadota bacterium]
MTAPLVKGYCPGALRPMRAGDGILVRVRPFEGRLTADQAQGVARLAQRFGNGCLDLSSRANLQIRGVSEKNYLPLLDGLLSLGLLDSDPQVESRRNILISPFHADGDGTAALARRLTRALARQDAPQPSGKFGYALDAGPKPMLQAASADVRIERDAAGGLILCADGAAMGKAVSDETAVRDALELAQWFIAVRRDQTRMAQLWPSGFEVPAGHDVPRQAHAPKIVPGSRAEGMLVALTFGTLSAETLTALAICGALRLTPWRMLLIEGARDVPEIDGIITQAADPFLSITACPGAPKCAQAHASTRTLARDLAPRLRGRDHLHISGCAKGCAHPGRAPVTLTATAEGFDLIREGRASDAPALTGLKRADVYKAI